MEESEKKCKRCGGLFIGSTYTYYCDKCSLKAVQEHSWNKWEKNTPKISKTQSEKEQICQICGKTFFCYHNKKTCGKDCEFKLHQINRTGRKMSEQAKEKIKIV